MVHCKTFTNPPEKVHSYSSAFGTVSTSDIAAGDASSTSLFLYEREFYSISTSLSFDEIDYVIDSKFCISTTAVDVGRILCEHSSAQENMTTAGTPDGTGAMMGNKENQTGQGNETKGPLEQMGETLSGVFGGNQVQ
jgi:hypothetical protein